MFGGRAVEAKKKLINLLLQRLQTEVGMRPHSGEITIVETPKANWGSRGKPGDELVLNYQVSV